MKVHAAESSLYLAEVADLERDPAPELIRPHLEVFRRTVRWVEEYLVNPHPELGREGPVCPYAQTAMRKQLLYLTACRGTELTAEGMDELLLAYRDWFLELEPTNGGDATFKAILVLFPELPQAAWTGAIESTQERLKRDFVAKGLMLGEFHPGPPRKAGLWNRDFRPLECPIPLLAIRHMVATDPLFLREDRQLMAAYLGRFGNQIPAFLRDEVRGAVMALGLPVAEPEGLDAVHPRVVEVLRSRKVPVVLHEHKKLPQPIRGPRDVARAVGYPIERISRSALLRCHCHQRHSLWIGPVAAPVDLAAVSRLLGCARLAFADDREITAVLGFSPGGISPVAVGGLPVFLEESLLAFPTVLVAAGVQELEIEIDPRLLVELTGAQVVSSAPLPALVCGWFKQLFDGSPGRARGGTMMMANSSSVWPLVGLVAVSALLLSCRTPPARAKPTPEAAVETWVGTRRDAADGSEAPLTIRVSQSLGGAARLEEILVERGDEPYRGLMIELRDRQTGQWRRHYANAARGRFIPFEGTVEAKRSSWRSIDPERSRESKLDLEWPSPGQWRRTQQISEDGGKSWKVLWVDELSRQ